MTTTQNSAALHLDWADTDEGGFAGDLSGEAVRIGDNAHEPYETLALACSAASVSQALRKALDHPWALYTPQEAAVVASALHAQALETVSSYRRLAAALEHMAARGDIEVPRPAGPGPESAENLGDALDRLKGIASELEYPLASMAAAAATLHRSPADFEPQEGAHGTVRAVAGLIGGDAKVTVHEIGDDHEGDACECSLEIHHGDETYYLGHGELGWSLLRASDAKVDADGMMSWSGGIDFLTVRDGQVHPVQLAHEVQAAMGA